MESISSFRVSMATFEKTAVEFLKGYYPDLVPEREGVDLFDKCRNTGISLREAEERLSNEINIIAKQELNNILDDSKKQLAIERVFMKVFGVAVTPMDHDLSVVELDREMEGICNNSIFTGVETVDPEVALNNKATTVFNLLLQFEHIRGMSEWKTAMRAKRKMHVGTPLGNSTALPKECDNSLYRTTLEVPPLSRDQKNRIKNCTLLLKKLDRPGMSLHLWDALCSYAKEVLQTDGVIEKPGPIEQTTPEALEGQVELLESLTEERVQNYLHAKNFFNKQKEELKIKKQPTLARK